MPSDIAVSLEHIVKSFDGREVLSDLSIAVARGEFLAIVGPSGSGKTTAMRIIGGFEMPDSGIVRLAGQDVTDIPAEKRNVNTVFQSYALFPHMTALDNIAYGPRMRGLSRARRNARAQELLDLVRLPDAGGRKPHELSGGMQQRVALARALANEPAVLLLDEPLGALDRKLRDEMQRELRRIQTELGATFIYITHDQDEAFGMADRLAVMRAGRFEQIGDPATIYDRPVNAWVALFVGSANTIRARADGSGRFASDLGPIEAVQVDDGLPSDGPALIVVRPEETRFSPLASPAAVVANRLPARMIDLVSVGPSRRLRAVTADGIAFESIETRSSEERAASLAPGDPVFVTFSAASARAYRDDGDASPSLRP